MILRLIGLTPPSGRPLSPWTSRCASCGTSVLQALRSGQHARSAGVQGPPRSQARPGGIELECDRSVLIQDGSHPVSRAVLRPAVVLGSAGSASGRIGSVITRPSVFSRGGALLVSRVITRGRRRDGLLSRRVAMSGPNLVGSSTSNRSPETEAGIERPACEARSGDNQGTRTLTTTASPLPRTTLLTTAPPAESEPPLAPTITVICGASNRHPADVCRYLLRAA
jgi:hypothetical protein